VDHNSREKAKIYLPASDEAYAGPSPVFTRWKGPAATETPTEGHNNGLAEQ
jgi:hypothetical protein